jgi:hypothetical protein
VVFVPLFVWIPTVYVLYAGAHVLYMKLLPPSGKRRLLTIYFGRLCLVFMIMWIPTFFVLFLAREWLSRVGGTWSHLQGGKPWGLHQLSVVIFVWKIVANYFGYNYSLSLLCHRKHDFVAVSAAISLLKPDIWKAAKDFICCRCNQGCEIALNGNNSSSNWELSSLRLSSVVCNSNGVQNLYTRMIDWASIFWEQF